MNKGGHNPDVSQKCRWCGANHGVLCPYVKALEINPETGAITRVEFLVPTDYPRQTLPDSPIGGDNYEKLGG